MVEGSASTVINRPAREVFDALSNVTRMGEWSPECIAARWVPPAEGPGPGVKFEGDNLVKVGPMALKRWTTTCEVTEFVPNEVFEFVAEGFTRWRYALKDQGSSTLVTESFSHEPHKGWQRLVYDILAGRHAAMLRGIRKTLSNMKTILES